MFVYDIMANQVTEMTVYEIAERFEKKQPTISYYAKKVRLSKV